MSAMWWPDLNTQNLEDLSSILCTSALGSRTHRSRLCLHNEGGDSVQFMIIFALKDSFIPIHKHRLGPEFYVPLQGRARLIRFDKDNIVDLVKVMGGKEEKCEPSVFSIEPQIFHTVVVDGDHFMYIEFKNCSNEGNDYLKDCKANSTQDLSYFRSLKVGDILDS